MARSLIECIDRSILGRRRTLTQQLENIGRKVSKTINAAPDLDLTGRQPRRFNTALHKYVMYVVTRVGRLIRVVLAGVISLVLAVVLSVLLLFWRPRR